MLSGKELLYDRAYWHKLLHFKNTESEIDDKRFFLSVEGKVSPRAELEATLEALKKSDYRDINGTACRYPARTRWLKERLPNGGIRECKYLANNLEQFDFKTLYLVYTSSFMNAPASMVGHTFLRFDKDENTPLLSYALNYSAEIDINTSPLSYVYNGIFGGFEGRYRVVPYYEMVKLYSDMEHRDMWEYKLDLTPKEIERVVLHMFEMQSFYSDYLFFNENCSYNLLWFIELAREDLRLVDKFNYITAPLDTIKELERQKLIKSSTLRASKTTKIKEIYSKIRDKKIAKNFLKETNLSEIKELSLSEQQDILTLYFLKTENINLDILNHRSQLGIQKNKNQKLKNRAKSNPLKSNLATKVTLSFFAKEPEIGLRLAYHDIYDVDYDFNEGSYISFFDMKVTTKKLHALTLINIDSLSKHDDLYSPYSWGVSFGFNRELEDELTSNLKLKGGKSFELFEALLFVEPTFAMYYKEKPILSLGYELGFLKSFRDIKIGLLWTHSYFKNRDELSNEEAFFTYQILENMALNFSILRTEEEKNINFKLFFYF